MEQAARHCTLAYPEKTIDIEMGNHHASGFADITVASIQSIMSRDRILKFDPSRYKLVLVDEAHHIVSNSYLELLQHFGLRHKAEVETATSPALVGVSATFFRFDGLQLGTAIDHIVYHKDYMNMIEEGWLSDVMFTTVECKADLKEVATGPNGDFQTGALSRAMNTEETNDIIFQSWLLKAKERKSTLVFCVDLNHVSALTAKFRSHGIDARFVSGDTHKKVRSERVEAFKNGEFPVLINCGVFTEGTDIPNIDCVLLARPTKSRGLLIQMIGRGMRRHAEKVNCHIIDMVSSLSTGLVSTPTLFGLDPAEIVENATSKDMAEKKERKEQALIKAHESASIDHQPQASIAPSRAHSTKISFTDYDSLHDLLQDDPEYKHIRRISQLAWVWVWDDKYVLTTNGGHYLLIEGPRAQNSNEWVVIYYRKLPAGLRSPYAAPTMIARAETLEHAVHAADTFAMETFTFVYISKNQAWRKTPASEAQLKFLNKFRAKDEQLAEGSITKGQAGDMIARIKHGARGKWDKAATVKRVLQRKKAKEQRMDQRMQGTVQVGPLTLQAV